jgi:cell division septum initiation protein DivIVA
LNNIAAISAIVAAAVTFLGATGRWVKQILAEVRKLLTELKNNTTAVKSIGDKVDSNQTTVQSTLTDHETRIRTIEGKVGA